MGALDFVKELASDAITSYGSPVTHVRTRHRFDPKTGDSTPTVTKTTIKGAVGRWTASAVGENGEVVVSGGVKITIGADALPTAPTADDQIELGGQTLDVLSVEELIASDVTAAFTIRCSG